MRSHVRDSTPSMRMRWRVLAYNGVNGHCREILISKIWRGRTSLEWMATDGLEALKVAREATIRTQLKAREEPRKMGEA